MHLNDFLYDRGNEVLDRSCRMMFYFEVLSRRTQNKSALFLSSYLHHFLFVEVMPKNALKPEQCDIIFLNNRERRLWKSGTLAAEQLFIIQNLDIAHTVGHTLLLDHCYSWPYAILILTVSSHIFALGQKRNVGVIDVQDVSGVHLN